MTVRLLFLSFLLITGCTRPSLNENQSVKISSIHDQQLAEAERLRQPQEEHHASRIGRVVADAMANSGNPGLMGMGETMQGVVKRRDEERRPHICRRGNYRGCCSRHGGLLGCINYRIICQDETESLTCTCPSDYCVFAN